jgi:cyanophycin synthetase
VITGVGDRRDEDIIAMGEEAAKIFDEIIIRHDEDMRGRTYEEIDRLLSVGIHKVDRNKPISYYGSECDAVQQVLSEGKRGSVIVVLVDNVTNVIQCLRRFQEQEQAQLMSMVKAG